MPADDVSPHILAGFRMVDLTLLIAEELPSAWSTHMPYQQKTFNYFTDVDRQVSPLKSATGPTKPGGC